MNAKEKLLNKINFVAPVSTQMIRKLNNLIVDTEKVLVVWTEDQTSHNIILNQSLIQNKSLTLFNTIKAESDKVTEEKFEASRSWFIRFNERRNFHNIEVQGETASADIETEASESEDLNKKVNKGSYTKQHFQCRQNNLILIEDAI